MDPRDGPRVDERADGPRSDRARRSRHRRSAVVGALLLGLLLVVAAVLPAGVAAQSASISVTVDGTPVESGGKTTVTADPTVGVDVAADATIESVIVRVNGDTVETYEPGATTFSGSADVALVDGENELSVVVQTEDGVNSQRVTVTRDDHGPFVRFTSPFETDHYRQVVPNTTTLNNSSVTLAGVLHDASGVSRVTIEREYQYSHANEQFQANARWDLEDPPDAFSQGIFLGLGANDVTVRVVDTFGQSREYHTRLNVTDSVDPTVHFDLPNETHGSTLDLDGEVTDNTQLDDVSVKVAGFGGVQGGFDGIDKEPDPSAARIPLSGTLALQPGENTIVVTATDVAGNTVEAEKTVVYTRSVVPNVRLDEEATTVGTDGTVHVEGVAEDGEITRLTIDAVDADTEEVVDLARVYTGGDVEETVPISTSLDLADGRTRVVVRVTDSNDAEHQTSFLVDASGAIRWEEPDAGDGPAANASTGGNETAGNESDAGDAGGSTAPTTTTPPPDGGMLGALPLPGFTGVTAAAALAVVAVLAAVVRRRGP